MIGLIWGMIQCLKVMGSILIFMAALFDPFIKALTKC